MASFRGRAGFSPTVGGNPGFPGSMPPPMPPSINSGISKSRTSHACDRCRMMRTKCSGGLRCTKCIKDDTVCAYGDRKRERNKKDLAESVERINTLEEENTELLAALRTLALSPGLQNDQHRDLMELLAKYSNEEDDNTSKESSSRAQSLQDSSSKLEVQSASVNTSSRGGERSTSSIVGSPGTQGELRKIVDLDFGTGASGYVGKMSEISWMQRAREYLASPVRRDGLDTSRSQIDAHSLAATDFSYFMDDQNLLSVDEDRVQPLQWPPLEMALILSEAFFHSMQGAFRFLVREQFLQILCQFPRDQLLLSWSERRWLALANLVWAIGAKWLHMSKLDHAGYWETDIMYYARARALGLDHRVLFDHPDVDRVQGIGLLAFFLFINGSISRSYTTLGHAIRHATALGLHLKVTDPNIDGREQARRARTWYSLYSLEILISETTGRPKSISLADVTIDASTLEIPEHYMADDGIESTMTPAQSRKLWLDFLHADRDLPQGMTGGVVPWRNFAAIGQHVSVAHFPCHVRLCEISDNVGLSLYRGLQTQPWLETQDRIGELQTELRHWFESLPDYLNISSQTPAEVDPRSKIELSMYFHSVQMIIHRVCLCEIKIPDQSTRSLEFNRSSARACVHAAISMLAIMPDNPSAHEAYQLLPWWTLLHYISQALAVLLLELCLDIQHFPAEISEIETYLRKGMRYLFCLADGSLSAYKAWKIFRRLLADVSERYNNLSLADVLMQVPNPPPTGWSEQDDVMLDGVAE